MLQIDKKTALLQLGQFLQQFGTEQPIKNSAVLHNDLFFDRMLGHIETAQHYNGWFTPEQMRFAVQSWAAALTKSNLDTWLEGYDFSETSPKTIGLVLAGNIPLVGFHDVLSVLVSGHHALVKTSSNDQKMVPFLVEYLIACQPEFQNCITFTEGKLEGFEAVIATGSNNTARYFEYYFKDKPSIIRKNRNSVAVLDGTESKEDLIQLGEDIFRYFGLGCRNVSKLFVPEGYSFATFFEAMYTYNDLIQYDKYANNYDYNKAVYLMSLFPILDNGFLTIKEDSGYASPISSVFYEYYSHLDDVKKRLSEEADQLQCIVSNELIPNSIPFGKTQRPELWDYADHVNTLDFLKSI
ncbi:acyl-CoA reductase [Flavobacterium stagni]|uniref:Acyl-CoA reductase n=1 Tax=Flavobacterium stagni TaxID=2506421 RepID=A0A4Q1K8V8_9FLAO|nr:acyl-CoA reductase [Flavobacterium stagni]RXR22641.1 acyl-CoA reductase [Flavobacterium stagni]